LFGYHKNFTLLFLGSANQPMPMSLLKDWAFFLFLLDFKSTNFRCELSNQTLFQETFFVGYITLHKESRWFNLLSCVYKSFLPFAFFQQVFGPIYTAILFDLDYIVDFKSSRLRLDELFFLALRSFLVPFFLLIFLLRSLKINLQ